MGTFVRLVGAPRIEVAGRVHAPPPGRVAALLYVLAVRGDWVPRSDLVLLFWPDQDDGHARGNLRQVLRIARRLPFAAALEIERQRVRWPVATDLDGDAEDAPTSGALLEGFALSGAPEFDRWLEVERARVRKRQQRSLLRRAEAAADGGAVGGDPVLDALTAWLEEDPLDEDVLHALLRRALAAGRPGTALRSYAAFRRRLADDLGLEPSPATEALVADLAAEAPRTRDRPSARAATVPSPPVARPEPRHAFVGREAERDALLRATTLGPRSVAVVVGLGGVGKSRLAYEVAAQAAARFAGGSAFVRLDGVASVEDAIGPLAEALDVPRDAPGDLLRRTLAHLHARPALVVLDNVEQLPGVDAWLNRLSDGAPESAWLATSRVRLAVAGATTVELGGLLWRTGVDAAFADAPATRLLVAALERSGRPVDLVADREPIARICAATDGLPLALEFAAPWSRVLPLSDVAAQLEAGLEVLEPIRPDAGDDRHAGVRRVLDTSWAALPGPLRDALLRAAPFRGGATREAIAAVADVGLADLARLRDASFVAIDDDGRIVQHPLVAAFVRERAAERPEALAAARERHGRWWFAQLGRLEDRAQKGDTRASIRAIQADLANLEAAWAWAIEARAFEVFRATGPIFGMSLAFGGRPHRWHELLEEALAHVPRDHWVWPKLECSAASADLWAGRLDRAWARVEEGVARARATGDRWIVAWALMHWWQTAWKRGAFEAARGGLREMAAHFAALDEPDLETMAVSMLFDLQDEPEAREALHAEAVSALRRAKSTTRSATHDRAYARFVHATYGDRDRALRLTERAVAIERAQGFHTIARATGCCQAANLWLDAGDVARAKSYVDEALRLLAPFQSGVPTDPRFPELVAARVALLAGAPDEARAWLERAGPSRHGVEGCLVDAALALEAGDLDGAQRHADAAVLAVGHPPQGRDGHLDLVRALAASARASLAHGHGSRAAHELARAAAIVLRWRFGPAASEVLAVALPLLPDEPAAEARRAIAAYPGTAWDVRRRAVPAAEEAPLVLDLEAAWRRLHDAVEATTAWLDAAVAATPSSRPEAAVANDPGA